MSLTLGRRGLLLGGALLGGTALAGCTSNTPAAGPESGANVGAGGDNAAPGREVTIGFSAPAADHGWMAAISRNATAQAEQFPDVTLQATEGTNDVNQQIAQVETLINGRPDVLVVLPFDGAALTTVGRAAMDAGIPVVNIDRVFDTALAYRTWIGGDNYGMGVSAGTWIADHLTRNQVTDPVIGEIAGIDSLPLTRQRSQGFADALAARGFSVGPRVSAEFTVESGERQTANLLQSASRLDAVWNHDDDQGVGVLAAIEAAGRSEFVLVGGAGSTNAMDRIKADDGVLKATVLYSPTMASSAIGLARLIGQGRGLGDLVEHEVPTSITAHSATVTRENVDEYLPVGFAS
ncbi:substrate-binding domain-containing protein [Pseudonocardia sp. HH130630-07]|uniref:substrate-binding domain-containing protein n=1 Tax=Pseudonocardia sp. HH130630-07 TaxID=1690815 RepID=UPI000814C577|nr:substrate-binding domain-containing protein [Pseudonocardia sp. HH130630-07]ANY06168.1 sugar ABC transporter substrate-binding protein [Pseudonocardia sp. HH130630-07]